MFGLTNVNGVFLNYKTSTKYESTQEKLLYSCVLLVIHRKPGICDNCWCVKCKVLHFYFKTRIIISLIVKQKWHNICSNEALTNSYKLFLNCKFTTPVTVRTCALQKSNWIWASLWLLKRLKTLKCIVFEHRVDQ